MIRRQHSREANREHATLGYQKEQTREKGMCSKTKEEEIEEEVCQIGQAIVVFKQQRPDLIQPIRHLSSNNELLFTVDDV